MKLWTATLAAGALGCALAVAPTPRHDALAVDAGPTDAARPHLRPHPDMTEARLAFLRTALKITDAQSRPWNAFADVLRKQAADKEAWFKTAHEDRDHKFTAVDRLDNRQKMLARAAANTADLLAAAKPLYASLSDEQKAIADEVLVRGGHGGGWRMKGPGMRHGPVRPE